MGPIRALVVDDDDLVLRSTCRVMRRVADVTPSLGAAPALSLLERGDRFDVILSDVSMPGINGKELLERASAIDPSIAARFVFVTGGGTTPELEAFIRRAERVLMKPVDVLELHAMIRRVAGREA